MAGPDCDPSTEIGSNNPRPREPSLHDDASYAATLTAFRKQFASSYVSASTTTPTAQLSTTNPTMLDQIKSVFSTVAISSPSPKQARLSSSSLSTEQPNKDISTAFERSGWAFI